MAERPRVNPVAIVARIARGPVGEGCAAEAEIALVSSREPQRVAGRRAGLFVPVDAGSGVLALGEDDRLGRREASTVTSSCGLCNPQQIGQAPLQ